MKTKKKNKKAPKRASQQDVIDAMDRQTEVMRDLVAEYKRANESRSCWWLPMGHGSVSTKP